MKKRMPDFFRIAATATVLAVVFLAATLVIAGTNGASLPLDFRSWTHTKSMVIPDKSHGLYGFHNIYANDEALQTLREGGKYEDGSVFVVSFYEVVTEDGATVQGKKLKDLLMFKAEKAAKTGGWIYAAFGPDGKSLDIDPVKACYECHYRGAKKTAFIFSKYVD